MAESPHPADKVAELIAARLSDRCQPLVVAVDGRSGVGKSTFASALAARLPAVILEGDDFFAGGASVSGDPPELLASRCIDWRRLRSVLDALLDEGRVEYFPFDWGAFDDSLSAEATQMEARAVIILEGAYSARPELEDLIDFAILLELPENTRMERLLQREGEIGPWERQWHRAEDWYFANVVSPDRFDLVIGSQDQAAM